MFSFSTNPPKGWQELCEQQGYIFHSPSWQRMLEKSFSVVSIYGWNADIETGIAITVFKTSIFRVGYVGFPVGGTLGKQFFTNEVVLALSKARFPSKLHLIRLPVSAFHECDQLNQNFVTTSETAIVNLQEWDVSKIPKLNRDVKKAHRSGLRVIEASPLLSHGTKCHELYKDTVQRHDGNLRYSKKYFNSLIDLTQTQCNLRCIVAMLDEEVAGFIVVALDGETAYYLHGAMEPSLRRYCASDRLLYEAICWAKEKKMNTFNLMSSPNNQSSLIRYKEKWGGITKSHNVYELPINFLHTNVFKCAIWFRKHLSKIYM